MSQNVSTKPLASEELEDYIATPPPSVDAYADRLMDDLFQDVDRILEGGAQLPKKTLQEEFLSLQPITVPAIVVPLTPKPAETPKPDDAQVVEAKVVAEGKKSHFGQAFDRWLLGAAGVSLLVTLGLWLGSRAEVRKLLAPAPKPSPEAKPVKSEAKAAADAKFAKYVQDAIANIEQKARARKQVAQQIPAGRPQVPVAQTVQPTITLPPLPLTLNLSDATTLAQSLNRLAASLEKLNAAANAPAKTATATPAAKPATAAANKPAAPAQTAAPSPAAAASPTATARPAASPSPTAAATAVAAAPAAPQTTAPSPTATPAQAVTAAPPAQAKPAQPTAEPTPEATTAEPTEEPTPEAAAVAPTVEPLPQIAVPPAAEPPVAAVVPDVSVEGAVHKLVGVLELGDRSAALFEINGAVQRVNMGESIGASGWTLVEVSKGEAIIRRNGEVRSIYVEQRF